MLIVRVRLAVFVTVDTGNDVIVGGRLMTLGTIELSMRARIDVERVIEHRPLPGVGVMACFAVRRKSCGKMIGI